VQDLLGRLQWFQLCYLRDTRRERVLEWKRGRGFLHMRIEQPDYAADRNSGALAPDGAMPYTDVQERFAAASAALPSAVATFVANKVREYARA
jgi:hypothetical protein